MSLVINLSFEMEDVQGMSQAAALLAMLAGSGAAVVSEAKADTPEPVNTAAVFAQVPPAQPVVAAPPAPPVPTQPSAVVAPPAPVAAPSAPPAPPVPGELDKQGLPWDARINTKNKEKTQKGIYKTTKGLPDGYYDQVVAELRQTYPLPGTPVPTPPAPTASAVQTTTVPPPPSASPVAVASPTIPTPPAASATPVPPVPPAPVSDTPAGYVLTAAAQGQTYTALITLGWTQETLIANGLMIQAAPPTPPVPPAPAEPVPSNFGELMGHITKMMPAGKITTDEVNAVCQQYGLTQLSDVGGNQHLVPQIYEGCRAIWSAR